MNNPWSTHDLKYIDGAVIDGMRVGRIYNNTITGFVYDFDLKYSTKKEAFRYSMAILKNASLLKRLHHA